MTTFEYRIIVNEELYDNNPSSVLHEIRSMAYNQLSKEVKNVDREKMELVLGAIDEKTMTRTIRVTYRSMEEPLPQPGPAQGSQMVEEDEVEVVEDDCPNCGENYNYCMCGDQAKAPTAQEIWDALPEVEGYV